jgi:hypothetical protein
LQKDANNIQNITNLIKESGMSMDNIEFDEDGRITNYTSVLESLERQIQEKQ